MRDPRNWVRPAVALMAGTGAGAGLVLLRARRRQAARAAAGMSELRELAGQTAQEFAEGARRLLDREP